MTNWEAKFIRGELRRRGSFTHLELVETIQATRCRWSQSARECMTELVKLGFADFDQQTDTYTLKK